MIQPKTASWMWMGEDDVAGVRLDAAKRELYWSVGIGCHCDSPDDVQSVSAYWQKGVPGLIPLPPADVTAELEETLRQMEA